MKQKTPRKCIRRLAGSASGVALALAAGAPFAQAAPPVLPSGGVVAAGTATISKNGSNATIVQSSNKAVINWQDFSVSNGASVTFQQPDSTSIILNRVIGPSDSSIRGDLTANGQVWLINSNGILFGTASRINVGGLIATTSDIGNADFLSGNYNFGGASANPDADIVNRGTITAASGGSVVLSAARVANRGMIQANLGYVVVGGASTFSIDFDGDKLLSYAITAPVPEAPKNGSGNPRVALVVSPGTIVADGGKVLMTARAADTVVDDVINANGIIQARSVSVQNGEVVLDAGDGGAVTVSGTLDVSGHNPGETGGSIAVHGEQITVADGAGLDASGDAGGGEIAIGTNVAGGGSQNSQIVTVGKALLTADATARGSGGTIRVTSAGQTTVGASLSAKGGAYGGGGGYVETSGLSLQVTEDTHVDTSSSNGATGTGEWLLSSHDIDVDAVLATGIAGSLATTNVTVSADYGIAIDTPLSYTSPNALTLATQSDINFNAPVQNTGTGTILATAQGDVTLASTASIHSGGAGTAVVIVADGNFDNQAGADAIDVSGGGRWLVFLDNPERNFSGSLSASPFYNRSFSFFGNNYAEISAGNRFVYAIAPVLTISVDDKTKTYGTANPALTATITGALPGDAGGGITGAPSFYTFAVPYSGVGDYAITGNSGTLVSDFNYGFRLVGGTLHVDPATLTASLTGNVEKAYDGTTSAALTAVNYRLSGVVLEGTVALNDPAGGLYDNKNAGSGKTVSVSGLSLTGVDKDNYVLASSSLSAKIGVIDAATLTASLTGTVEKTYDGNNSAALTASNYHLGGIVSDDDVVLNTAASGLYDNKNAGTGKTISVGGLTLTGADKGNYVLASSILSAKVGVIDAATLTASLTGTVEKTYDGNNSAALTASNYHLDGIVSDDDVALNTTTSGLYDNKNAGTGKTVNIGGLTLTGADKGNYVLASSILSAKVGVIDAAALTASLTGTVGKTYDGTTSAALAAANYHLAGIVGADNVTLNDPASGFYDNKDAGTGKTVSVSGLALLGADKDNYVLASSSVSGAVGVITASVDVLGNTFTSSPISSVQNPPLVSVIQLPPPITTPPPSASDATSDTTSATGGGPTDVVADKVGQSLSGTPGSVQSSSYVLIQGLLRQFLPPPGGTQPHGVPPIGQIYSSWGNEAFWQ